MTENKSFYVIIGRESFEEDFKAVDSVLDTDDTNSVYVFCSEKYISNKTDILQRENVFRLLEPISNIFTPMWRQSSTEYPVLRWMIHTDEVPVWFCTFDEEIYNDMDYYCHIRNFGNKTKMLLTVDKASTSKSVYQAEEEPLVSRITDPEIIELGRAHLKLFKTAGYDKLENGPIPGFALQPGTDWLTRLADLYNLRTKNHRDVIKFHDYSDIGKITSSLMNPIIHGDAYIGRDLRMSIVESRHTRAKLVELTEKLLKV